MGGECMRFGLFFVSLFAFFGAASPLVPQATGSYRVHLCRPSCPEASSDSEDAIAVQLTVVLVADSAKLAEIPQEIREDLRKASDSMLGAEGFPNGCFRITHRVPETEFYLGGMEMAGLTAWQEMDGGFRVSLERSPDSGTWLEISVTPGTDQLRGRGVRRLPTGRSVENWADVRGRRLGEPNTNLCLPDH